MLSNYKLAVKHFFAGMLILLSGSIISQDGTIYPLENQPEPNAIPLNTGGVEDQPAEETWFWRPVEISKLSFLQQ